MKCALWKTQSHLTHATENMTSWIDNQNQCKSTRSGLDYTGRIAVTVYGYTCQDWISQYPHQHSIGTSIHPHQHNIGTNIQEHNRQDIE